MTVDERYEELVDQYACDDDSLLVLARMVAELEEYLAKREEYVNFLVRELGEAQHEVEMYRAREYDAQQAD